MTSDESGTYPPHVPTGPPAEAQEVVLRQHANGTRQMARYQVGGETVWVRHWDESGYLAMEYGMRDDKRHGPFRTYFPNGQRVEESFYIEGKEHGTARQWDYDGRLLGVYTMNHGTGVDQWFFERGVLSEERQYLDGDKHGVERDYWPDGNNSRIAGEIYYKNWVEHGIQRSWNSQGRLRRGFPHYFVDGKRVTKRQYLRACTNDPSLPVFRAEENENFRQPLQPFVPLPPEEPLNQDSGPP